MAKNYELGKDYYLPVTVHKDGSEDNAKFPIGIKYNDGNKEMTDYIMDKPDLLLTASEIAAKFRYRRNIEQEERFEKLERENQELKDENGKLTAKVDDLEADLQNAKAAIDHYHEVEHRRVGYTDKQTQAINRKDKEIEILIDRITKLEAELAEEREKYNG